MTKSTTNKKKKKKMKARTTSGGLEHAQCVTLNVIASLDVTSLGARQARDVSGAGAEHGPKGRLVIG